MLKNIHMPLSTYIAVGIIIGIYLSMIHIPLLPLFLLFSIVIFFKNKKLSPKIVPPLLALIIGYSLYQQKNHSFNIFESQISKKSFNIAGVITDYQKIEGGRFKHRLTIKTKILVNKEQVIKSQKYIYIYTQKFPKAYIDDFIIIKNLEFKKSSKGFKDYLIKNNIASSVFKSKLNFQKLPKPKTVSLAKYKNFIMRKINSKMSPKTKAAFNSIFLGNKFCYKKELELIRENFLTWGTVHYLARSGLHLVIIASIWQTACIAVQIPFLAGNIVTLVLILIFCLLSWPAIPFIRALSILIIYRICNFFELQSNLINSLNISCILTLMHCPTSLFFLDFQLSFALTYGLVLFGKISRIKKNNI